MQHRPDQPGAVKVRTYQTHTAQGGLAELRFQEVKTGEVGSGEVKPRPVEQGLDRPRAAGELVKVIEVLFERPAHVRVIGPA
ncbi:MAG: hypothetical protein WB800_23010, partial [Streptosporangiaceae bacterium]